MHEDSGSCDTDQTKAEELSELDKSLKRNAESVQFASNLWGFGIEANPDHVPAWTKRRRL